MVASYPGNITFPAAISNTVSLTAQPLITSLSLTASPTGASYDQPITLTAKLTPAFSATLTTEGQVVSFKAGNRNLGMAPLRAGIATLSTAEIDAGSQNLMAAFAGDQNFSAASANAVVGIAPVVPVLHFTVADHTFGDAPFSVAAVSPSQGAITYTFGVGSSGATFPEAVNFSVAGYPRERLPP